MSKKKHVPIRMCIGCRKRREKEEMVRFIKGSDGILLFDQKKKFNGRGYYLCHDRICLKLAQKKQKGFESLKSKGLLSSSIEEWIF
jgi:predicted RNA-binding protein YlxR (DUF448 family)